MDGESPILLCIFLCIFSKQWLPTWAPLKKLAKLKKNGSNRSSDVGDIAKLKSTPFFQNFCDTEKLQCEFEILGCLDKDFQHMGRCKIVLLFPKTGYNKYSKLYWLSDVHFNFGATFRVDFLWIHALLPRFSRYLLHIHQCHHNSIWLGFLRDVPSHPKLCRHLLLYQQPTSQLWVNQTKSLSSKSIF